MTLTTQFYTLLAMIGMGSCFGASLDTYQLFLKRSKRSRWIVFIHDVLFWIIQALLVFYVLLLVNQGELRFYSFIALLCGFAAYQALFKKVYMFVLNTIIYFCKSTAIFLKKLCIILIVKPLIGIVTAVVFLLKFVMRILLAIVRSILRIVLFILRVIFKPFVLILRQIYKLLPKTFTNKFQKIYNRIKGFFVNVKNYVISALEKWKNRKNT